MIARLLISTSEKIREEEIEKILTQFQIPHTHPDLLYFQKGDKLGIPEARKIKDHFSLKPYSAKGRVVVLEDASTLTTEAQNALLKTLEELPKQALVILCAASDAHFLPTVLSRCEIVRLQGTGDRLQGTEEIEKLLKSNIADRFEYIEKLKEREEFLHSLVSYFHQKLPANKDFTAELLQAEQWAAQNVNIRAILEYLMLVMPGSNMLN